MGPGLEEAAGVKGEVERGKSSKEVKRDLERRQSGL